MHGVKTAQGVALCQVGGKVFVEIESHEMLPVGPDRLLQPSIAVLIKIAAVKTPGSCSRRTRA
jgi:hypothetical protein